MGQYQKFMFDNFVIKCDDEDCAVEPIDVEILEEETVPQAAPHPEIADAQYSEVPEKEEVAKAEPEIIPEPVKTYTQEELDEQIKRAEELGYERGFKSSAEDNEKQTVLLLDNLNNKLMALIAAASEDQKQQEQNVLALSKEIILKLLPSLSEDNAVAEIEKFLTDNFPNFSKEAKLSFYFHPDMLKKVQEIIARLANTNDFEGKISLHKDTALGMDDCRVEWENGGVEKNMHKMLEKVSNILDDDNKTNSEN